ncbi:MAG: hypothetical protein ACFFAH_04610 [Promethearchaeota archaeon]
MYSGGSDSTLTAALMCDQFEEVHLLSYFHRGIPLIERTKINVKRISKKYRNNKIIHKLINIEDLYKKIYYDKYFKDLLKYKTYITSCSCNACQLAMHAATVIYCLKNSIYYVCDGYKREKKHIYAFMAKEGINETKKFYKKFNIEYANPVYDIVRTDWELFEMGITQKKNVKFPYERLDFSTQHHCHNGTLVNAYLMGYYMPIFGQRKNLEISIDYWKEKIEFLINYIKKFKKKQK